MFQITRDPSSGSFIQCLANITITVILDKHCIKLPDDAFLNIFKYFIIIQTVSTNYIFVHLFGNKVF